MAFNKKEIAEQLKQMERQGELQGKLNDSALAYAKHMREIAELQKNIAHIAGTLAELEADKLKIKKDVADKEAANLKLGKKVTKEDKTQLKN